MEWKRAGSKGGIYPLLGNVDAVVVAVGVAAVDGGVGDVEVGGDGCEDRLGLEGERRERDRDLRTVMGSLEDGSVAAGCGAMRAKEAGWIRRRGDGFYSIELAKQQTAVLIASVGIIKPLVVWRWLPFSQYFCRGFAIALTIRLFVTVELAMLFSIVTRSATDHADRERPALFVDSNQWSIMMSTA